MSGIYIFIAKPTHRHQDWKCTHSFTLMFTHAQYISTSNVSDEQKSDPPLNVIHNFCIEWYINKNINVPSTSTLVRFSDSRDHQNVVSPTTLSFDMFSLRLIADLSACRGISIELRPLACTDRSLRNTRLCTKHERDSRSHTVECSFTQNTHNSHWSPLKAVFYVWGCPFSCVHARVLAHE